jgi:copper chaperone
MTCGHCVSTITKALKAEDPHASVEIALAQKLVSVESTLPAEEIAACIAAAGYTPRPA